MLFRNLTIAKRIKKLSRNINATDISVNVSADWDDAASELPSTSCSSSQFAGSRVSDSSKEIIGGPPESMLVCKANSRMVPQSRLRSSALSWVMLGSLSGSLCRPFTMRGQLGPDKTSISLSRIGKIVERLPLTE